MSFSDPFPDLDVLNGPQAVIYLAARWGMDSYSSGAFRAYRFRNAKFFAELGIKPEEYSIRTATFWRKNVLDRIPKPDLSKPRGSRKKEEDDEGDTCLSPVVSLGSRGRLNYMNELVGVR